MRTRSRRLVKVLAVVITASLSLAGCSADAARSADKSALTADAGGDQETGGLTVWVDSERLDLLEAPATDYEAKTGTTVTLVPRDAASLKDDFIREVPAGDGPDIVMGSNDWLGELVAEGVIAPIRLGDKADEFSDVALNAATYNGTIYELPYSVENVVLLRNADLVKVPAATFADMIAMGNASGAKYPFLVQQGDEGDAYHLYPFQTSFGAPLFNSATNGGGHAASDVQLGGLGGAAFARWLASQGKAGTGVLSTDLSGDAAMSTFSAGDAAFWLTGSWNVKAVRNAGINLAVDAIAAPGSKQAQSFVSVKGFFVSQQSRNTRAANDFLVNYLGTEAVQTAMFNSGGVLPALKVSAAVASSNPVMSELAEPGKDGVLLPAIPEMGRVWQLWGSAEAAIINGADPVVTWQKLTSDIQAAIDE